MSILIRRGLPGLMLLLLALAGCGGPTQYMAAGEGDYGYSDSQLESNRYRVSFRGNSRTDRETVENYLLYRAAEITLANDADYFIAVGKDTSKETRERRSYTGLATSPFVFGFGFGGDVVTSSTEKYEAAGEITLHQGSKPQDNPHAYSARELLKNLEPKIKRKPQ